MIEITPEHNKKFQEFLRFFEEQISTNGPNPLVDLTIPTLVLNVFGIADQATINSNPDECKALLKRKMPAVAEAKRRGETRYDITALYSNPKKYGLIGINPPVQSSVIVYDLSQGETRVYRYSWDKIEVVEMDSPTNKRVSALTQMASELKVEELEARVNDGDCKWIIEQILGDNERKPVIVSKIHEEYSDEVKKEKISNFYLKELAKEVASQESE